jgi:hypothetical protein
VDYRFRYRIKNAVGWSEYSPVSYILAASLPSRAPRPVLVSASDAGITLSLSPTSEDGGSPIIKYKIFRDAGDSLGALTYGTELTDYDG